MLRTFEEAAAAQSEQCVSWEQRSCILLPERNVPSCVACTSTSGSHKAQFQSTGVKGLFQTTYSCAIDKAVTLSMLLSIGSSCHPMARPGPKPRENPLRSPLKRP